MSTSKEIMDLLHGINGLLDKGLKSYYANNALSVPQLTVVTLLSAQQSMKISDISKEMHISTAAVTGLIDRLEHQGLVARNRSLTDRRIVNVTLTDTFKNTHHNLGQNITGFLQLLLREQEPAKVEALITSLQFLKETLTIGDTYLEAHISKHSQTQNQPK